jgi:hypothetical protein
MFSKEKKLTKRKFDVVRRGVCGMGVHVYDTYVIGCMVAERHGQHQIG